LSTIVIFATLSELGISNTLVRFVSRSLGHANKKRAKSYLVYLAKIKFILVLISMAVLVVLSKYLSNIYFQKPLFLAFIAGSLYILFQGAATFMQAVLPAFNYFKGIFTNEVFFQITKLVLVPVVIILTLKYSLSNQYILFYVILALSTSYLFSFLFMLFFPLRKSNPLKNEKSKIKLKNHKEENKFLLSAAALILSGVFFGYVDKVVLGHFVASEFIGYYSVALTLIGGAASLLGFGSSALLPIFSRIDNKEQLQRGLTKSLKITLFASFIIFIGTIIIASPLIIILYGSSYSPAVNMLRAMSLLLFIIPLIGIYSTYFLSKGKPNILVFFLIISTVVNIGLNYLFISLLLKYSQLWATYGTIIAITISNLVYLLGMMIFKKYKKM
jgi:O-antigen/teichoic acid export membrane protein